MHRGFSAACPALRQWPPVNCPFPGLHLGYLQLESCLFIPIYHKPPKAGTNVVKIKSNLTGEKKKGDRCRREQRSNRKYPSSVVLGCQRNEQAPPNHLLCFHILCRAQYQAFHPGVMLAACSPCGDKGKPDVLCAKTAAPAPGVPWKPAPAAVILSLLAGTTMAPRATPGHCTGFCRLTLSEVILMNYQLLD